MKKSEEFTISRSENGIPYAELEFDFENWDESNILVDFIVSYIRKTFKGNNKKLMDFSKLIPKIRYYYVIRDITNSEFRMTKTLNIPISKSKLLSIDEDSILCIGCIEYNYRNVMYGSLNSNSNNTNSNSNSNNNNNGNRNTNYNQNWNVNRKKTENIINIRMYLLGFISMADSAIKLATEVNADRWKKLNRTFRTSDVNRVLNCSSLTLDPSELLESDQRIMDTNNSNSNSNSNVKSQPDDRVEHEERGGGGEEDPLPTLTIDVNNTTTTKKSSINSVNSNSNSNNNNNKRRKLNKIDDPFKSLKNNFLYMFSLPPSSHYVSFLSNPENRLDILVRSRLDVLITLMAPSFFSSYRYNSVFHYQRSLLPINTPSAFDRDKVSIYFLMTVFCHDESLLNWWITAESKALSNNLKNIVDIEEKMSVCMINKVDVDEIKDGVSKYHDVDTMIVEKIANRMFTISRICKDNFDNGKINMHAALQKLAVACINRANNSICQFVEKEMVYDMSNRYMDGSNDSDKIDVDVGHGDNDDDGEKESKDKNDQENTYRMDFDSQIQLEFDE